MVNLSTAYKNADVTGIAQTCSKWEPASHSKGTFKKKEVIKGLKLLLVIGMADLPASSLPFSLPEYLFMVIEWKSLVVFLGVIFECYQ